LPLAAFSSGLLNDDADQRISSVVVLSNGAAYLQLSERAVYERILIAALSDPNIRVREFAAAALRAFRSPAGDAALALAIKGPEVTDMLFWLATGRKRPFSGEAPTESSFPPETVAVVRALAPDFLVTLSTREDAAVRRLIEALEKTPAPATTPILVWLLMYGDMRSYGDWIGARLAQPPHIGRLPVAELLTSLPTSGPDQREKMALLIGRVLRTRAPLPTERRRLIAALTDLLYDPTQRSLARRRGAACRRLRSGTCADCGAGRTGRHGVFCGNIYSRARSRRQHPSYVRSRTAGTFSRAAAPRRGDARILASRKAAGSGSRGTTSLLGSAGYRSRTRDALRATRGPLGISVRHRRLDLVVAERWFAEWIE
jgi:hypothetical protein